MKNYLATFWNSSTLERFRNKLGLVTKLQSKVPVHPRIGMAVLVYERPEYLQVSLDTLFQTKLYDYDLTVFLCDDGSQDPRVKAIMEEPRDPRFNVIRWYFPKGPNSAGAAINRAMRKLLHYDHFDIVGWADPDIIYHPEWLKHTLEICLWAKAHHSEQVLGPFTSFNSSDFEYHRILGRYNSPFGKYLIKRQSGMANYFYLTEDFEKLGYFEETLEDESRMTERLETLKVRNFCPEISYVEHIGQESVLNQWRPQKYERAMFAMNPAPEGWTVDLKKYRTFSPDYYGHYQELYDKKIAELELKRSTPLWQRLLKSLHRD